MGSGTFTGTDAHARDGASLATGTDTRGRNAGVSSATESGGERVPGGISARASRRLYLPTVVIAGLAAWLSWQGWEALEQSGVGRVINIDRFDLAGPAVIGFVLVVMTVEQLWPAERRPVLARGHLLDLGYLLF